MSLWTVAEEKRIAALADEKEAACKRMWAADVDYTAAEKSGELHPEDANGR